MKQQNLKKIITIGLISVSFFTTTPANALTKWKQENGSWVYVEGQKHTTGWTYIDGNWYYFDNDGYMKTGWIKDNGKWYFADRDGVMKTGNLLINNKIYSFALTGEEIRPKGTVDIEIYSAACGKTEIDGKDVIEEVSDDFRSDNYFRDKSYYEENVGTHDTGIDIITFKGVKEGSAKVTIKTGWYSTNFDKVKGTTYVITVDKDLNTSITKLN